jgi:hypothetical protein
LRLDDYAVAALLLLDQRVMNRSRAIDRSQENARRITVDEAMIWVNGFVDDERGNRWRVGANRDAA